MIVPDLDTLAQHIPSVAQMEWNDIKSYVEESELWLTRNILGTPLSEYLIEFRKAADPVTFEVDLESEENDLLVSEFNEQLLADEGVNPEFLKLAQKAIAYRAFWIAIPFLDLILTPNGFGVVKNNNVSPASKERVAKLREATLKQRDVTEELLIEFLEEHQVYHTYWKVSPAFSVLSDCLIQTAKELKGLTQWEGERKDFLLLRPIIKVRTHTELFPWFSRNYIDELLEKLRDADLSPADIEIIEYIKASVALLVTDKGADAKKLINDTINVMESDIDNYPTYRDSSERAARTAHIYKNEKDHTTFFFG